MSYLILKEWRRNTKQKLVEALGSSCQICGYNKCNQVLELHHLNPNEKDFHMSQMNRKSWDKIKVEASKCILLCANCHREVHANITELPIIFQHFDENLILSSKTKPEDTPCKECGLLKDHKLQFCSHKCADTNKQKVYLTKNELENYLIVHKGNLTAISKLIGISANAIKKKCLKENLNPKDYKRFTN